MVKRGRNTRRRDARTRRQRQRGGTPRVSLRSAASLSATLAVVGLFGAATGARAGDPPSSPAPPAPEPAGPPVPAGPVEIAGPVLPAGPPAPEDFAPTVAVNALPPPTGKGANGQKPGSAKSVDAKVGDDPAQPKSNAEKLLGPLGKGLTITGGASLRMMQNSVAGGQSGAQAYSDQNLTNLDYRNVGGMQQNADLTIQGRIFNAFDVNARLSNSKYGNQFDQIFSFNYKNRANTTRLGIGNVSQTLPGNELVTFSRSLQGVTFYRDFGKSKYVTQGLASLTKAVTKRGSIRGNGTVGPYFMNASNIVEGTERIRLNGQDLKPGGIDYKIDYLLGQLQFTAPIKPEDTVEFTYESKNYSTTPGLLSGLRWDSHDDKGNAYGVTFLSQKAQGQRVYNGNVVEKFPVYADLSYKYTLASLIDPAYPVTIQWNNRPLVENVDYYLNRALRYFQLLTASLPPDTSVSGMTSLSATYRPLRQNSIAGDRAVLGLDSTLRVAPNGNVGIQFGSSNADSSTQAGRGLIVNTNWQSPEKGSRNHWQLTAGYRDIGDTFSTIDSTAGAFLQAEKGIRAAFNFQPNPLYSFTSSLTRSQVANRGVSVSTTGVNSAPIWATNESLNAGMTINLPNVPISLQHRQTTQGSGGSSSTKNTFASDEIHASWKASSILSLSGAITQTTTRGRSVFASSYNNSVPNNGAQTGSTIIDQLQDATNQSATDSSSTSTSLQASLQPKAWIGLTANIGFTNLKSSSGTTGSSATGDSNSKSGSRARSVGLGLTLMPLRGMNITGNYTDSSNGQSLEQYYNPGSGGSSTIIPTNTSGQKTRSMTAGMQYVPFERLQIGANINRTLSLVPGYDNTDSNSSDLMVNATMARWLQLTFSGIQQSVTYVGGQGDSRNKSMTLSANIGPFGRMTFNSALTKMNFGSAVYTGTSGGVTGGSAGGYDPGSNSGTGASYLQSGNNLSWVMDGRYDIGRRQALVATWRMIDQGSPTSGSGSDNSAYRAGTDFWQGTASLGYDIRLNEIMGFRVDFNLIRMIDRQDSRYSYRARTVTADLTARF